MSHENEDDPDLVRCPHCHKAYYLSTISTLRHDNRDLRFEVSVGRSKIEYLLDKLEQAEVDNAALRKVLESLIETRHECIIGSEQYISKSRLAGHDWEVTPDAAIDAAIEAVKGETP
jgi:hypothetical protein